MKNVEGLRYKRSLYVGLGGAGANALSDLKRKILEANEQKLPKQIKFLLIDTNAIELSNYNNFDASEKICIAVREPYERYRTDKSLGRCTHEYIPSVNSNFLLALERGAGQIRSNGHFAVIENQSSNKLMRIFHERADELMGIDIDGATLEKDPKIEVRLVFSLAGGTGSGTFLPISVLLRSALKHCELIAYAISPAHYERTVENSAKKAVMANGYVALAELDYMMHFGRTNINQENIKFNFGPDLSTQQIEQPNRPFDEVYFIDKRTNLPLSDSIEYTYNERDRVFNNVADIIHIASTSIISGHTGTVDNVRQKISEGQFDVDDKFGWVNGVGMAEIFLDPKDSTSREIREAAIKYIEERIREAEISEEIAKSIGLQFIGEEWNESGDSNDKDKVQDTFIGAGALRGECEKVCSENNGSGEKIVDLKLKKPLNKIIDEIQGRGVKEIIEDRTSEYVRKLEDFIEKFVDCKTKSSIILGGIPGFDKEKVRSLRSLKLVLEDIKNRLDESKRKLKTEKEEVYDKNVNKYDALRAGTTQSQSTTVPHNSNTTPQKGSLLDPIKEVFRLKRNTTTQQPATAPKNVNENAENEARGYQMEGLYNAMLADRAQEAINLLEVCEAKTDEKLSEIEAWIELLSSCESVGKNGLSNEPSDLKNVEEPQNRVQVYMSDVKDDYILSYSAIKALAAKKNSQLPEYRPEDIYSEICKELSKEFGSLKRYLIKGIQEIDSVKGAEKTRGRQGRTKCQEAISQLIDLSAPTLQIDGHGYGSRVKADQFYYIMTSNDAVTDNDLNDTLTENGQGDSSNSDSTLKNVKEKTVAGLLKYLVEQNSLDIHVNCVNVSGWKNKAVLYRVKGAIPPYFIEGVAKSTLGGQTMEDCYEELKKTRPTYTPFSHDTLRQRLESGISVLRPHDSTSESEAMEHWVNFLLLTELGHKGYIHFKENYSDIYTNCKKKLGAKGSYSIVSESLGKIQTESLDDRTKILILGYNRVDAFHRFARYCKDILLEHRDYVERMKHPEYCEDAEKIMNLSGKDYLDKIFHGNLNELFFDEQDKELLRREMEYIDKRCKKYKEQKCFQEDKKEIASEHKNDFTEESDN